MHAFQAYQAAFTAHIRDPKTNKKPAKVNDTRMAVYREIVFNNILGSVSACFPVCQRMLGKRAWRKLARQFFAQHHAGTPLFREIPQEFLAFLNTQSVPEHIKQLAHYEWVELAVASNLASLLAPAAHPAEDILNKLLALNPTAMLLQYDYEVQKLYKKEKPEPVKTHLLVFRNVDFAVKFIELNSATYELLRIVSAKKRNGKQTLKAFAQAAGQPLSAIESFGVEILNDLLKQHALQV